MHLGMLSMFGFVHLAAGPVRPASESTGILRNSALQFGLLGIFGLLHLASRPGVYRRTEEVATEKVRRGDSGSTIGHL